MNNRLKYCIALICSLFTLIVFAGMPNLAFAATGPNHHGKPTSSGTPTVPACEEGWYYDNISIQGYPLAQVGPTYRDYNGTGNNETDTFTATTSGTISLSVSAEVSVNANVIIGSVQAKTGLSVTTSITATVGNQVQMTVPPHKAGYAAYGVFRVETTGHYYFRFMNCVIGTDDGYITTYSPWYVGWNTWTGN